MMASLNQPGALLRVNKDVPIPRAQRHVPASRRKYPFEDMEIGDMFFVPGKEKNTLATHASTTGKQLGRQFITRLLWMVQLEDGDWVNQYGVDGEVYDVVSDTEGATLGIGVWRVK